MMHIPTAFWGCLGMASIAAALPGPSKSSSNSEIINFDNIETPPIKVAGAVIPQATIPRPYRGICFDNFIPGNQSLQLGGVKPHSQPNDAINAPESGGNGMLSAGGDCPNSAKAFTLKSFWAGCEEVAFQGEADAPLACTLTIIGTPTKPNAPKATKTYDYKPELQGLVAPMQKIDFSNSQGFEKLSKVEIKRGGFVTGEVTVLGADDFEIDLFN